MTTNTATFAEHLQTFAGDLSRLREKMRAQLYSDVPLIDMMKDEHYFTGGKQLRALMALLAARLHGLNAETADSVAIGIEFIHTATLLHDDVVDDAALRRHQPTARATYGNEAAVLAGDFLYSRASQLFSQIGNVCLLQRIADATNQLAQGELIQLLQRGDSALSEDDYRRIIEKKTANLFSAATAAATILDTNEDRADSPLSIFGFQLGIAFQLIDDYLDYASTASGKSTGADFKERKMTLPMIILLNRVDTQTRENLLSQWQQPNNDDDDKHLQTLIGLMKTHDVFAEVQQQAAQCVQKATAALHQYDKSKTREQMLNLATTSIHRTY